MLRRVQTRQGLDTVAADLRQFRRIIADEAQPRYLAVQWANVDDGNRHEHQKVRHEAINPGANVDVPFWRAFEDLARGPQVLMKIMTFRHAGSGVTIGED